MPMKFWNQMNPGRLLQDWYSTYRKALRDYGRRAQAARIAWGAVGEQSSKPKRVHAARHSALRSKRAA